MQARRYFEGDLQFALKSPFATGANSVQRIDLDSNILRGHDGRLMIPGTLLKGVIRDAFGQLAEQKIGGAPATRFIGDPSQATGAEIGGNVPLRTRLFIGDALAEEYHEEGLSNRTKIDDLRQSVETGALQTIPLGARLGKTVRFAARIGLWATDEEKEEFRTSLETASMMIQAIGANKSVGFGFLSEPLSLENLSANAGPFLKEEVLSDQVLELELDGPLVVSTEQIAGNVFVSSRNIPGSALKAALAEALSHLGHGSESELQSAISDVRITHAMPVSGAEDETILLERIPRNLISTDEGRMLLDDSSMVPGSEAMRYPVDYKSADRARASHWLAHAGFTLAEYTPLRADSRTRTAVADDTESGGLFTYAGYSCFVPGDGNAKQKWKCRITGRKEALNTVLPYLLHTPIHIGKLNSRCHIQASGNSGNFSIEAGLDGACTQLTLTSDAVLFSPEDYASSADRQLLPLLASYFREFVHKDIEVRSCWVDVRIVGGYPIRRFRPFGDEYRPLILCRSGSVVELSWSQSAHDQIGSRLSELYREGLPVGLTGKQTWKNQPFVPSNGYGSFEILRARGGK